MFRTSTVFSAGLQSPSCLNSEPGARQPLVNNFKQDLSSKSVTKKASLVLRMFSLTHHRIDGSQPGTSTGTLPAGYFPTGERATTERCAGHDKSNQLRRYSGIPAYGQSKTVQYVGYTGHSKEKCAAICLSACRRFQSPCWPLHRKDACSQKSVIKHRSSSTPPQGPLL